MKRILASTLLLSFLSAAAWAATCLPTANNTINVDGIVVAQTGGAVPAGCSSSGPDAAWGGVLGQEFKLPIGQVPDSKKANLFLATRQAGNKVEKVYFGVHVENVADFTTNDKLTLYFQADGNKGTFDPTNDFALVFDGVGPAAATPLSQDGCANVGNPPRYYKFDTGNNAWVPQASVPAGINFKTSYDFETPHDAETGIWELEIEVDLSVLNPGLTISNGGKVGIGGKLYLFDAGAAAVTSFKFPQGVAPSDPFLDPNPNQGGVTVSTLEKITVGTCNFDVIIASYQGSNNQGNPGQFSVLNPSSAADFDQATGNVKPGRANHFTTTVKFVNPSNMTDTSVVAVPNSGQVSMKLKPWNGGFTGEIPITSPVTASFNQLGQSIPISRDWPQNKSQWNTLLNTPGHVCFAVDLSGYPVDDVNNGNHILQNLSYVSASTIKTEFLVAAPRELPGVEIGRDGIEYLLRARWDNLTDKQLTGNRPFSYKITNARQLKLKRLGKDYYTMRLKPGEQKRVMLAITGGEMPSPVQQYKLEANAGGKLLNPPSGGPPVELAVKPNAPISILARGLITVERHAPTDANGYSNREQRGEFLLRRGVYRPEDHVGAVIGSCDGFNTSFLIGTDRTFMVPEGCEKLALAINNVAGAYDNARGLFELSVMIGAPVSLPTRVGARGGVANPKFGIPAEMQPGSVLPKLVFDVGQRFPTRKRGLYRLAPTGYVDYAIYMSHPDR